METYSGDSIAPSTSVADANTECGGVDTSLSGIALMKEEEAYLKTYFNTVFCKRDFEKLEEYIDSDYIAFTSPETLIEEKKASFQNLAPGLQLLLFSD